MIFAGWLPPLCCLPLDVTCKIASHRNNLPSISLADRGSYNDRLLVLKAQNVLNLVFAAVIKGLRLGLFADRASKPPSEGIGTTRRTLSQGPYYRHCRKRENNSRASGRQAGSNPGIGPKSLPVPRCAKGPRPRHSAVGPRHEARVSWRAP
jgi:hypothetical protein